MAPTPPGPHPKPPGRPPEPTRPPGRPDPGRPPRHNEGDVITEQVLEDDRIAYSRAEAAQMTSYSEYQIGLAVRSGDLRESYPVVNGRTLKRGRILREDLLAWMRGGESS